MQSVDVEEAGMIDRRYLKSLAQLERHLQTRVEQESRTGIGTDLSAAPSFWTAYRMWRLRILLPPFTELECAEATRVATALQGYLGLTPEEAERQARRNVFSRRERLLHETFLLDLKPELLHVLLDAITVEGDDQLRNLSDRRGVLLLSAHYGPYSSLLLLWLIRATASGLFNHLSILLNSGEIGGVGLPASRVDELEAGGLGLRAATTLLDSETGSIATRHLVAHLRAGGAGLVFPEGAFVSSAHAAEIPIRLGERTMHIPRGAAWLARLTGCQVVPVHIKPLGDSYQLRFGRPASSADGPIAAVQSTVRYLLEQTALADPGLWDGWSALPPISASDGGVPCGLTAAKGGSDL